jgi:hypothetical protein
MTDAGLELHPEAQRLLRAREILRESLADLLEEWHALHHTVKSNLLALFQQKVGVWELKRLEKQVTARRLRRHMELIQAAVNRGEKPAWVAIRAQVDEEWMLWRIKVEEAAKALRDADLWLKSLLPPEEARELKKVYHLLVKRLHPDLHPAQPPECAALWGQVLAAYERGDVETLRALMALSEKTLPVEASPANALDALRAENDATGARIESMRDRIARTRQEAPFTLEHLLSDPAWVESQRAKLENEMSALDVQIESLQSQLKGMLPTHVPPDDNIVFGTN